MLLTSNVTSDLIRTNKACIIKIHLRETEYAEGDAWDIVSKRLSAAVAGYVFQEWTHNISIPRALEGLATPHQEVDSEALP